MEIYIPTRGRPGAQYTHNIIEDIKQKHFLVPNRIEDLPTGKAPKTKVLYCDLPGIRAKRQFILDNSTSNKILMLDDDLRSFRRRVGGKFVRCGPEDIKSMLSLIEDMLDDFAHVGIIDEFMCHTRPKQPLTMGRYNSLLAYNKKLFPKPAPKFRLELCEEHDFSLQLITQGRPPAIITEYTRSTKPYAEGGCSAWRTEKLEQVVHEKFAKLWPEYVTLRKSKNNISKSRVQIAWAKLKKIKELVSCKKPRSLSK